MLYTPDSNRSIRNPDLIRKGWIPGLDMCEPKSGPAKGDIAARKPPRSMMIVNENLTKP